MKTRALPVVFFACAIALLAGCAATHGGDSRPAQRPRVQPPQQPPDSIRLVIYRPQGLVGMWGRPVVVVNDRKMLTALGDSMLDPGTVFVVDAPAARTEVGWIQSRQTAVAADPHVFEGLPGATRYLRWTLKPTYGYLEPVTEEVARGEIGPLLYMGYRSLVAAASR